MAKDKKKDDPSSTSEAYDIMAPRWNKINSLLGGSETMRASDYIYQHQFEKDSVFNSRKAAATLFNMTDLTLETWVGRPFAEDIKLNEDVPASIVEMLQDCDLQGNNLQVFARSWFRDGLAKAFSHVLVEYPRIYAKPDNRPRTLADDKAENLRPYFCHIPPESIIFAQAEIIGGVEQLTHIRIQEQMTVREGFIEVTTPQIRIIEPGLVQIWQYIKAKGGKIRWVKTEEYGFDLPFIPLVTFYAAKAAPFLGKPPLLDLADLNITHFQSASDQRHSLTMARFPILAGSGVSKDDEIVLGPNKYLATKDPDGKFYYVEHTGAALEAGQTDLTELEKQMAQYGAEFLQKKPGGQTATARALDSAEATSPLQDVTVRFEDALNQALDFMAQWMGEATGGTVVVNKEFGPDDLNASDLTTLDKARDRKDISREAYIDELKSRKIINKDYDPEADNELLKEETAQMVKAMSELDEGAPQPGAGAGGGAGAA